MIFTLHIFYNVAQKGYIIENDVVKYTTPFIISNSIECHYRWGYYHPLGVSLLYAFARYPIKYPHFSWPSMPIINTTDNKKALNR
jgi:hypothetical protein